MSYQHWLLLSRFTHPSRVSDSLGWCDSLTTVALWPPGAGEAPAHLTSTHSLGDSPGARLENGRISRDLPEFGRETETVPSIEARQTESLRVPYFLQILLAIPNFKQVLLQSQEPCFRGDADVAEKELVLIGHSEETECVCWVYQYQVQRKLQFPQTLKSRPNIQKWVQPGL